MTCNYQQCGILKSVDSDEPVQPSFKLRNSKLCSVSSLTLIKYSSDYQRLDSDCVYAQADLRLCWSHIPYCWKSHATAQLIFLYNLTVSVLWLFLTVSRVVLQFVIVVFPDHTYLFCFREDRYSHAEAYFIQINSCCIILNFALFWIFSTTKQTSSGQCCYSALTFYKLCILKDICY